MLGPVLGRARLPASYWRKQRKIPPAPARAWLAALPLTRVLPILANGHKRLFAFGRLTLP